MKKLFAGIFAAVLISASAFAQDVITTRAGEDIKAKVTEIGLADIKYKKWESPEGPVGVIPKAEVLLIRYEDGTKDLFEQEAESASSTGVVSALSSGGMYQRGQTDAQKFYKSYKQTTPVVLVSSLLLGPVIGLIPTVATASTTPRAHNLDYPSESLIRNREYAQGYTRQARHIKSGKMWTNYAIGAGISIVLNLLLLAALGGF